MKIIIYTLMLLFIAVVANAACPQGTKLNNKTNICEGEVTCKYGYYNPDMRACESLPVGTDCPKGTDHDPMTDVCFSEPTCPSATMFDEKRYLCVGIPQ